MKRNNFWLFFLVRRFAFVDRRGRSAFTTALSLLGVAFGVMTLITVLAVMNGFQMGYIESILEVNSAHIRLQNKSAVPDDSLVSALREVKGVRSVFPFLEIQGLLESANGRQRGGIIRAVPDDIRALDEGFASAVSVTSGSFSLSRENSIVLGSELARLLGASVGGTLTLLAVSGGPDSDIFPQNAQFVVRGVCKTGFYEIDSSFAFISLEDGARFFGGEAPYVYAVKLLDAENDARILPIINSRAGELLDSPYSSESWRQFNRVFFGALRIEKNVMMLLIFLIFVVVGVNIYHALRRSVYERREEIGILAALGADALYIRGIFILGGFFIGLGGACLGLILGLLLAVNINAVFAFAERFINAVAAFCGALFAGAGGSSFSLFSPAYFYLTEVPARVVYSEAVAVCLFGVAAASFAAMKASAAVLSMRPAEILHNE